MLRLAVTSASKRHALVATTTATTLRACIPKYLSFPAIDGQLSPSSASPHISIAKFRSFSSSSSSGGGSGSWNWKEMTKLADGDESATTATTDQQHNGEENDEDETKKLLEAKIHSEILASCTSIHSSIMPLNDRARGPLARHSDQGTCLPFVFLVGNHSSGKSSFINYALGRDVQTAGVAPTDDCFTVITPGPEDSDQDGPALIGDPDMGFSPLRQFGPTLIHHTQLKVRSDITTSSFMMVDSPGMIDSPMSQGRMNTANGENAIMDRGYDFPGVVKWFAERADVVLLFFDPDKPGTTGETLSVLLHSLGGIEHKLLIVLNKADQFKKIHDFARAYGSLCWNLSKVIPRKDLPRIFTMCLPVKESERALAVKGGLADLHQTRDDVVAEVMKAPQRRIDNVITHLTDSVHLLLMHAKVAEDIRRKYANQQWKDRMGEIASAVAGVSAASLGIYAQLPAEVPGAIVASTIIGVGGLHWFNASNAKDNELQATSSEALAAAFRRTHAVEIREADEFAASTWKRIREPLRDNLKNTGLGDFSKVSDKEIAELERILEEDIPKLRRLASPTHVGTKS